MPREGIVAPVTNHLSSRFYFPSGVFVDNTLTFAAAANELDAAPLIVHSPVTIASLFLSNVTVAAAGNLRLGLYYDHGNQNQPGNLLTDAGEITHNVTGLRQIAVNVTLQPGKYWLAVLFQGTPTVRSHLNHADNWMPTMGNSSNTGTGANESVFVSQTYGPLPAQFPTPTSIDLGNVAPLAGYTI
jgi:hypothetical protein